MQKLLVGNRSVGNRDCRLTGPLPGVGGYEKNFQIKVIFLRRIRFRKI